MLSLDFALYIMIYLGFSNENMVSLSISLNILSVAVSASLYGCIYVCSIFFKLSMFCSGFKLFLVFNKPSPNCGPTTWTPLWSTVSRKSLIRWTLTRTVLACCRLFVAVLYTMLASSICIDFSHSRFRTTIFVFHQDR